MSWFMRGLLNTVFRSWYCVAVVVVRFVLRLFVRCLMLVCWRVDLCVLDIVCCLLVGDCSLLAVV